MRAIEEGGASEPPRNDRSTCPQIFSIRVSKNGDIPSDSMKVRGAYAEDTCLSRAFDLHFATVQSGTMSSVSFARRPGIRKRSFVTTQHRATSRTVRQGRRLNEHAHYFFFTNVPCCSVRSPRALLLSLHDCFRRPRGCRRLRVLRVKVVDRFQDWLWLFRMTHEECAGEK